MRISRSELFAVCPAVRNISAAITKDLSMDLSLSKLQFQTVLIWRAYTQRVSLRASPSPPKSAGGAAALSPARQGWVNHPQCPKRRRRDTCPLDLPSDLNFVNGAWPTLAPLVFARVGPLLFSAVIPTGMAGFFFRSRRANVGHGARILRPVCLTGTDGPWQPMTLTTPGGWPTD